jgi:RNA polymerase sigma-70 factor (ECF subfamily)
VALNRAVAVAEVAGPRAGLDLVDALEGMQAYYLWHAIRADLLRRLDRIDEAAAAYDAALALTENATEQAFLRNAKKALNRR